MASTNTIRVSWFLLLGLSCSLLIISAAAFDDDRQPYIVYMGGRHKGDPSASSRYMNNLKQVLGSKASESVLYTYKRSFHGFALKLTKEEKQKVAAMHGVVSVFPSGKKQPHTTRSWDFVGFSQQVNRSTTESDIIVGMIDYGIWPESDSFSDKGFGPPPAKWKGSCQNLKNFTCNYKIIGGKYYRSVGAFSQDDFESPRDSDGHGTHTSSTAAGGLVRMASLMGLGLGTARGGVPSARIAVYKVCWSDGCYDADILAAFDDAIADGVDILSVSLGALSGSPPSDYFSDSIAIGAFHAMKNGILTSASAGNDGPNLATVSNFAPWILTVAASTIDRKFLTNVQLGNKMVFQGVSINTFDLNNSVYPMIYGGNAPNISGGFNGSMSRNCIENSLDPTLVKGKIVLCDSFNHGQAALLAGAVGMVMQDTDYKDVAFSFALPAADLGVNDGANIFKYLNSTRKPTATITKSYAVNDTLAPNVASFSSTGPNPITSDILKPDLTAPGVDILAAWSLDGPLSGVQGDNRRVPYNIISGTSMACPHVTGSAAYIKSFHPSWSPAAIKSALMTTAFVMNSTVYPYEFGYGSGQVNPVMAVDPGLVYDADEIDYIQFLCGQGYNTTMLRLVTGDNSTCSEATNGTVWDLNLPTFALSTPPGISFSRNFSRTVTNVGLPNSTYIAKIAAPQVQIQVEPTVLSFTAVGQKLSFMVKMRGTIGSSTLVPASLVWDDGTHKVRSPIVIYANDF